MSSPLEDRDMLAPANRLLRAGIGLKLNQVKLATRSYLRDRTNQATSTVTSYAIAAGLFAAAGIFLIAACFVGTIALFRWVEINHGQFWGFGAVGALLVTIAAICAGVAASRSTAVAALPTLTSRLRVAIKANPLQPDQIEAAGIRRRRFCSHLRRRRPNRVPGGHGCTEQQKCACRPDRDGDLAGLRGDATAIEHATGGRLMPRARPTDNLILIAATARAPDCAAVFSDGPRTRSVGLHRARRLLPPQLTWIARPQPGGRLERDSVAHLRALQ